MSSLYSSFGTLMQVGDGATPENFATVAATGDITEPSPQRQYVDGTSMDAPGHDIQVPTYLKLGQCKYKVFVDPADPTHSSAAGLPHMRDNKKQGGYHFRIIHTDIAQTPTYFAAHVTDFAQKSTVKGLIEADVTLEVVSLPAATATYV